MAKALTLKELGELDVALKRAGIAMTKNVSVKLGQQSESPDTTESAGSDKPAAKPEPKARQVESKTTPEATEEKTCLLTRFERVRILLGPMSLVRGG